MMQRQRLTILRYKGIGKPAISFLRDNFRFVSSENFIALPPNFMFAVTMWSDEQLNKIAHNNHGNFIWDANLGGSSNLFKPIKPVQWPRPSNLLQRFHKAAWNLKHYPKHEIVIKNDKMVIVSQLRVVLTNHFGIKFCCLQKYENPHSVSYDINPPILICFRLNWKCVWISYFSQGQTADIARVKYVPFAAKIGKKINLLSLLKSSSSFLLLSCQWIIPFLQLIPESIHHKLAQKITIAWDLHQPSH